MKSGGLTRPIQSDYPFRRPFIPVTLIGAVAIQRPLQHIANNVGSGPSVGKSLMSAAVVFLVGVALYSIGRKAGLDSLVAALAAAIACLVFLNWSVGVATGWLSLTLIPAAVVVAMRLPQPLLLGVVLVSIGVFGGAPTAQLGIAVLSQGRVHIVETEPVTGVASARVEDVVVVILDEFAGAAALEEDFSHSIEDTSVALTEQGFVVPEVAWSTATSTFVSVTEMLEMAPLVPEGTVLSASDDAELYGRMGGENRFVKAFRGAGFHYTHIESGWEGTACGESVDTCLHAPWVDATVWQFWHPTLLASWLESMVADPFTHATQHGISQLAEVQEEYAANGRRDLVLAHILLPHGPFVFDRECRIDTGAGRDREPATLKEQRERYVGQVMCAQRRVEEIGSRVPPDTAIAIMSDHGTFVGNEPAQPIHEWDNRRAAQRLNVFMAYRLPPACDEPADVLTVQVTAGLLACALEVDPVVYEPQFTLVLNDPGGEREPVVTLEGRDMVSVRETYELEGIEGSS